MSIDLGIVEHHYRTRWGAPSRRSVFRDQVGEGVEVLKWDTDATDQGVALYATLGASAWPGSALNPLHRTEFIIGVEPEVDDIADPLARLSMFAHRESVTIDHGHTVPHHRPLWQGTEMARLLVFRQKSDMMPPLVLGGGVHVEFFMAIPLFEAEMEYKARHGVAALMALWCSADVEFWSSTRTLNNALFRDR